MKLQHAVVMMGGLVSACSNMNIQAHYEEMRPSMTRGDWKAAVASIEDAKKSGIYGEQDRVMYWLNYGTVLHYAGDYQKSQDVFVQAESAIQDLWTKSVTAEASTVSIVRPWRITVIRSAISRTSSSLWLMKMTVEPCAVSSRRFARSSSTSCGTRAAVGSSRIRILAPR